MRPVRPNHRNELWYRFQLNQIVAELREAGREIAAELAPAWPRVKDETDPKAPGLIERARAKLRAKVGSIAASLSFEAASRSLDAVDASLTASIEDSVGVNIRALLTSHGDIGDAMRDAVDANVELITSIPEQYFDKLGEAISESWTAGDRHEDLAEDIEHIGDVTESRAELIARDQTSKANAAFNKVRQTSVGIERYVWQTAEDERVRESHADLDGQTFAWDDPPTVDGEISNPGEPINCRCVAAPVLDLDDESEADAGAFEADEDDIAEAA